MMQPYTLMSEFHDAWHDAKEKSQETNPRAGERLESRVENSTVETPRGVRHNTALTSVDLHIPVISVISVIPRGPAAS
jgi:hypothetical protein